MTATVHSLAPSLAMAPEQLPLSQLPSPYITAPSSPKLHREDGAPESDLRDSARSFVPFIWEEEPGKPKLFAGAEDDGLEDSAFEFCVDRLDSFSLPAEDLFDGGKIRPLKPPPRLQLGASESTDSPAARGGRRSFSGSSRRMVIARSSRRSYDFSDPFEAAIESARKGDAENETGKTASFSGPKRIWRLRNLLSFKKFRGNEDPKAGTVQQPSRSSSSGLNSSSGPDSNPSSGSMYEPVNGVEVRGRSLTPCRRRRLLSCFVKRL